MTKQEAEQLIQKRGFRIWAILGNREFQAMDADGINLFVDWEQDNFRLVWMVPRSIFQVTCPECGPFSWDKQFYRMYGRFKNLIEEIVCKMDGGNRD